MVTLCVLVSYLRVVRSFQLSVKVRLQDEEPQVDDDRMDGRYENTHIWRPQTGADC